MIKTFKWHPVTLKMKSCLLFFNKDFIYLFMRATERGRDTGRERSRLHAGSLMWDSIPGLQDPRSPGSHPRLQGALNRCATRAALMVLIVLKIQLWAARVTQRFSAAFSPGRDPGDLGSSPTLGSLRGACFSLCLSLPLSLSVSMNK